MKIARYLAHGQISYGAVEGPKTRWFQFSLRTLIAVVCSRPQSPVVRAP